MSSPPPIPSIALLDGTSIPWLGWGNGTGSAYSDHAVAVECGKAVLDSGILHIDTAQNYSNERETGEAIKASGVGRDEVWVTSKISGISHKEPTPHDEVLSSIQSSLDNLGFVPDLYLIHSPFVAEPGKLKAMWKIFEGLKDEGKLKSIGVSNFRVKDLEEILDGAKYKPVVNQIEYHPYVLTHLEPVLELQAKHGIITQTYGLLTPTIRHPTGGPLKSVLEKISARISTLTGKDLDVNVVLFLWAKAQGVVVITSSGNLERIKWLREVGSLPDLLTQDEVEEISRVGKTIHYRYYTGHMQKDFPLPSLPSE